MTSGASNLPRKMVVKTMLSYDNAILTERTDIPASATPTGTALISSVTILALNLASINAKHAAPVFGKMKVSQKVSKKLAPQMA
jgi:hypothetical protein